MKKTILVTGATDGIGYETAKKLVEQGHHVLIHGRSEDKLNKVFEQLKTLLSVSSNEQSNEQSIEKYRADLSDLNQVRALAQAILQQHDRLDVLINNAGIFKTNNPITATGQDVRFVVNTLAPYILTQALLPIMNDSGRVVNLSSAAQAPIDLEALTGKVNINDDFSAYAQSKLAITMWSQFMAAELLDTGPSIIAINPGSMLASKMVKEGFGVAGNDLAIGADVLIRAALSDEFANSSGKYFDNDIQQFSPPHSDAGNPMKVQAVVTTIQSLVS